MKLIKWFAGFFQDKDKAASRKAAALYIGLWFLYMQVQASVNGSLKDEQINREVFWGTIVLVLFAVGAVTTEVIAKVFDSKYKNDEKNSSDPGN